jgi:hypothetical protein
LNLLTKYTQAKFDAKVAIVQAKVGGDRDVAISLVKATEAREHENTNKLAIISSNPLLVFLLLGFAVPLVIFEWKVVVVDITIGPGCIFGHCWEGNTDPIRGQVADWATTIIGFLFGSTTVLAAGKMYFGRKQVE